MLSRLFDLFHTLAAEIEATQEQLNDLLDTYGEIIDADTNYQAGYLSGYINAKTEDLEDIEDIYFHSD